MNDWMKSRTMSYISVRYWNCGLARSTARAIIRFMSMLSWLRDIIVTASWTQYYSYPSIHYSSHSNQNMFCAPLHAHSRRKNEKTRRCYVHNCLFCRHRGFTKPTHRATNNLTKNTVTNWQWLSRVLPIKSESTKLYERLFS